MPRKWKEALLESGFSEEELVDPSMGTAIEHCLHSKGFLNGGNSKQAQTGRRQESRRSLSRSRETGRQQQQVQAPHREVPSSPPLMLQQQNQQLQEQLLRNQQRLQHQQQPGFQEPERPHARQPGGKPNRATFRFQSPVTQGDPGPSHWESGFQRDSPSKSRFTRRLGGALAPGSPMRKIQGAIAGKLRSVRESQFLRRSPFSAAEQHQQQQLQSSRQQNQQEQPHKERIPQPEVMASPKQGSQGMLRRVSRKIRKSFSNIFKTADEIRTEVLAQEDERKRRQPPKNDDSSFFEDLTVREDFEATMGPTQPGQRPDRRQPSLRSKVRQTINKASLFIRKPLVDSPSPKGFLRQPSSLFKRTHNPAKPKQDQARAQQAPDAFFQHHEQQALAPQVPDAFFHQEHQQQQPQQPKFQQQEMPLQRYQPQQLHPEQQAYAVLPRFRAEPRPTLRPPGL